MTSLDHVIERNLGSVKERLEAACRRAGRHTSEVTLVGVTKYAQTDWVQRLIALGVQHLGESRPAAALPPLAHAIKDSDVATRLAATTGFCTLAKKSGAAASPYLL